MTTAGPPDAGSEPRLVLDEREWRLVDGENILGRDEGVTVRIDGAGVSRHHARIMIRSGRATIEDLGSRNGTFCGEARVSSPRPLGDGDVIRLGRKVRFVFRQHEAQATESELTTSPSAADAMFRREGELWTVMFEGQRVQLTDVKGFADLAQLLAHPGIEVHCLELAGRPAETAGGDAVLDDRARQEYRSRLADLQREIDGAERDSDLARGSRAREEMDALVEALSGALGLGGRSRSMGSATERARSAVTWRIRSAVRKIATVHPSLGRHFENSMRTGTYCSYQPERPIDWHF